MGDDYVPAEMGHAFVVKVHPPPLYAQISMPTYLKSPTFSKEKVVHEIMDMLRKEVEKQVAEQFHKQSEQMFAENHKDIEKYSAMVESYQKQALAAQFAEDDLWKLQDVLNNDLANTSAAALEQQQKFEWSAKTSSKDWSTASFGEVYENMKETYQSYVSNSNALGVAGNNPYYSPYVGGPQGGNSILSVLQEVFPGAMNLSATCPETGSQFFACSDKVTLLSDLIPHLNDTHRWKAARIAEWLENTFEPQELNS